MTTEQSKLQTQGNTLFKKLLDESTVEILPGKQKVEVRIWKGKITETCTALGIPYGSYRKVYLALQSMGAIQELAKGVRGTPTLIRIIQEPTDDLWEAFEGDLNARPALTRQAESARMAAEVRKFLDSIGGINIADALLNHEQRLTALESKSKSQKNKKES